MLTHAPTLNTLSSLPLTHSLRLTARVTSAAGGGGGARWLWFERRKLLLTFLGDSVGKPEIIPVNIARSLDDSVLANGLLPFRLSRSIPPLHLWVHVPPLV